MRTERWNEVRRLFHEALELPRADLPAYLERACAGDDELRAEVDALLASHEREEGALEELAAAELPAAIEDVLGPGLAGARIGPYELERVVAWGGMGIVYAARHGPDGGRVALKMLRCGPRSEAARRRLRYEAEILARLRHPAVARVYDAGTHRLGSRELPYFALEYVEGARTIRDHVREAGLGRRDRLRLFLEVCDAIQHGHRMGIIHRDLKPGNILVGADGRPKVIDYGIARMERGTGATTMHTQTGQILGTPQYMSPEQLEGDPAGIDTRTDVYSLGVLLYELLLERLPHDLEGRAPHEIVRCLREDPPRRPRAVDAALPRELEWILWKALEKDRERRYAAVSDLAADLERYLREEPVAAGPPSAAYRVKKYVRRHRVAVFAAAAIASSLMVGVVALFVGFREASDARREAEREREKARQAAVQATLVSEFLSEILAGAGPGGPDARVRDLVDAAASLVQRSFSDQPPVRAELHRAIGRSYHQLGSYEKARMHLEAALELHRAGEPEFEVLHASILDLGRLLRDDGELARAETLLLETWTARRDRLGAADPRTLDSAHHLAVLREAQGRLTEAETLHRETWRARRRVLGIDERETLSSQHGLARVLTRRSHAEAGELLEDLLERRTRRLGELHEETLAALADLGRLWLDRRDDARAEDAYQRLFAARTRRFGPHHPRTLRARQQLGRVLLGMGELERAEELFVELERLCREELPADDLMILESRLDVGLVRARRGHATSAVKELLGPAARELHRRLGEGHPLTRRAAALLDAWAPDAPSDDR